MKTVRDNTLIESESPFDKFMDDILLEERVRQPVNVDSEETPQRIRARARRERSANLIKFGSAKGAQ